MKVLFIPFRDMVHPWYDNVADPLAGRCEIELYDRNRSFEKQVAGVSVVVDQGGWGTRDMIDASVDAGVKLWQVLGTGLDHFDVDYVLSRRLTLANTPGQYSGSALAEHAILLMLCFAKNLDVCRRNAASGQFYLPFNEDLAGRSLGLVGFGASAKELARRARAFGMQLLAVEAVGIPDPVKYEFGLSFAGLPNELNDMLPRVDYLSLHVPLTDQTRGLLNRERLALLKATAVVINVARGGLINQQALVNALEQRRIRGAGLDVFEEEPLPSDSPLLRLDNVIATPHVAGGSRRTAELRGAAVVENIIRVQDSRPILHEITSPGAAEAPGHPGSNRTRSKSSHVGSEQ